MAGASTRQSVAAQRSRSTGRAEQLRVGAVGMSTAEPCGVRDHAVLLAEALARENVSCSLHWLWRDRSSSASASRSEVRRWIGTLADEIAQARLDAVLLHYSVFAFSHRGVPIFVRPLLAAIRASRVPLVSFMHEYSYPWRIGGIRGKGWALTQRALLIYLMRASAAVAVTADSRADWLASRVWLPNRPIAVAPVFSNLPSATARPQPRGDNHIGLFGYAYEGAAVGLILDALRLLADRGLEARLTLLGAPGRSSPAADAWIAAAEARGVAGALDFSGTLAPRDLADALAACDVLLSAEPTGPTSRKTTLAASLASGRPVVALDGRNRWAELSIAEAARIVQPRPHALAEALAALLEDEDLRDRLGQRGREFAGRSMSVDQSARIVAQLIEGVLRARA